MKKTVLKTKPNLFTTVTQSKAAWWYVTEEWVTTTTLLLHIALKGRGIDLTDNYPMYVH
jgi:hypothetical protein